MLIDTFLPNNVNLLEYPGEFVVSVVFRLGWELNKKESPWGSDSIHGKEGIWYRDHDNNIVKLKPFIKKQTHYIYNLTERIRCAPRADDKCSITNYFLIRYWNSDVYMPTIVSRRISIIERLENRKRVWEYIGFQSLVEGFELNI